VVFQAGTRLDSSKVHVRYMKMPGKRLSPQQLISDENAASKQSAQSESRSANSKKQGARDMILHAWIKPLQWHCMPLALILPTFRRIRTTSPRTDM
jgi:hypothetical protein